MTWSLVRKHLHYGATISITALGASAVLQWLPLPGPIHNSINLIPASAVVLGTLYQRSHGRNLCEQCASAMPLDAGEEAVRKRVWLRGAHAVSDSPVRMAVTSGVLVVLLIANSLLPRVLGAVAVTLYSSALSLCLWSSVIHGRYQPWCPWCHGPDDGWAEPATDPQPVISV